MADESEDGEDRGQPEGEAVNRLIRESQSAVRTLGGHSMEFSAAQKAVRAVRSLDLITVPKFDLGIDLSRLVEVPRLDRMIADVLGPVRDIAGALTTTNLAGPIAAVNAFQSIVGPFLEQQRSQFAALLESVRLASEWSRPSNWRGIELPDPTLLSTLVLDEGLPLAWTPPKRVLARLLTAKSRAERRRIIADSQAVIFDGLRQELDHITSQQGADYARFVHLSIDAIEDEHNEAGQALAANLLDTLVGGHIPNAKRVVARNQRPDLEEMWFTDALVIGAVWAAHLEFRPGFTVPQAFSRHASAHGVSRRQYSRRNAILACMHVASLLRYEEVTGGFDL